MQADFFSVGGNSLQVIRQQVMRFVIEVLGFREPSTCCRRALQNRHAALHMPSHSRVTPRMSCMRLVER